MIKPSLVLAASVLGHVIESPVSRYELCAESKHGGAAYLFEALMSTKSESKCENCHNNRRVILKCLKDGQSELSQSEIQMMVLLSESEFVPKVLELFNISPNPQQPCVAMEKVGINLESLRLYQGGYWPAVTLGTIGVSLLQAVRRFHNDYHVVHRDLHAGNVCLGNQPAGLSSKLFIIDLGDMIPLSSDERSSANYYRVDEVRQAVLTIRYLLDGDSKYYVTKRYAYDPIEICRDPKVPAPLCDALRYIFEISDESPSVDYDFLISKMKLLFAGERSDIQEGLIVWGPYIAEYGLPDIESLSSFRPLIMSAPTHHDDPTTTTTTTTPPNCTDNMNVHQTRTSIPRYDEVTTLSSTFSKSQTTIHGLSFQLSSLIVLFVILEPALPIA